MSFSRNSFKVVTLFAAFGLFLCALSVEASTGRHEIVFIEAMSPITIP